MAAENAIQVSQSLESSASDISKQDIFRNQADMLEHTNLPRTCNTEFVSTCCFTISHVGLYQHPKRSVSRNTRMLDLLNAVFGPH